MPKVRSRKTDVKDKMSLEYQANTKSVDDFKAWFDREYKCTASKWMDGFHWRVLKSLAEYGYIFMAYQGAESGSHDFERKSYDTGWFLFQKRDAETFDPFWTEIIMYKAKDD